MLVCLEKDFWDEYVPTEINEFAELLRELSRGINLSDYRKNPRGTKKKKAKRSKNVQSKHVSTAKRLKLKTVKDP